MSGKKQYQIAMANWFRTRVRRPLAEMLLPDVLQAVRAQQDAVLERDLQALRQQQERSEAMLTAFSERAREREATINRAMAEQIGRLERRLGSTQGELREEIAAQERAWREGLRQEREGRERLEVAVRELMDDRASAHAAAETMLSDAQAERDLIAATLPHEQYAPGELDRLDRRLATARKFLADGQAQAALAGAGQAYQDLNELRVELALRRSEWLELRWSAAEQLILIRELIRHSGRLPAELPEPGSTAQGHDVQIDVDHWSGGELRRLQDEVQRSLDQVTGERSRDVPPLTVDELRELADQRAPQFRRQVDDIVDLAQQRVQASQMRANIAELVASALEEGFAYAISYGDYEAGDERAAFSAHMAHLSGKEVVVHVRPVGERLTDSELEVLSYGDQDSPQQRRDRAEAFTRRLRERNLPVTALSESSEAPPRAGGPVPAPQEPRRQASPSQG